MATPISDRQAVFVVHHSYELDDIDQTKLIGVYSSRQLADEAVQRVQRLPGFSDHPNDFHIDEYRLDEDHWTRGFVSVS